VGRQAPVPPILLWSCAYQNNAVVHAVDYELAGGCQQIPQCD